MNYKQFIKEVENKIKDMMKEADVKVHQVMKNNAVALWGINIFEDNISVSPTIYLEEYYASYEQGRNMEDIIAQILDCYANYKSDNIEVDFFSDYDCVQENIVFKLINYAKNEELLKTIPHIKYLDLAIVFYYLYLGSSLGEGTIIITNEHLQMWGINQERLSEDAKENTSKLLPYELKHMDEVIKEILSEDLKEEFKRMTMDQTGCSEEDIGEEEAEEFVSQMISTLKQTPQNVEMFMLSNIYKSNGAACMLYHSVLQEAAKKRGKNIYILPSSVHEVILLFVNKGGETEKLKKMVTEINETQVAREEVLSNSIYRYDIKTDSIELL